jgi:hypothetical protein
MHPKEYVKLGDIDGSGTFLGDVLVELLNPATFEVRNEDRDREVRSSMATLAGENNDEVDVILNPGERGVRADILEANGQLGFEQRAEHTQLLTCGSVFRLPRKAEVGIWASHSNYGRSTKSLVAPELERLFRERFEDLRLQIRPSVNANAFKDALENDRLLGATLIKYEREPDISAEKEWAADETGLKLRLDIEPSGGKRLIPKRVLKALETNNLGNIVEFGGVKFDSANFKVKLPNGIERTFTVENPEKGFALSEEIRPSVARDGSLDQASLFKELGRVITELG